MLSSFNIYYERAAARGERTKRWKRKEEREREKKKSRGREEGGKKQG